MRRDDELLTKILLALEADDPVGDVGELAYLDDDWTVVNRHLDILAEKEMIRGDKFGPVNMDRSEWPWHDISLLDAGHDALAATRTNKAGKWWLDQAKAAGRMTAPALIAQAVAHPDELRHAAEALAAFMRSL